MAKYKEIYSKEFIDARTGEVQRIETAKIHTHKIKSIDENICIYNEYLQRDLNLKSYLAFKLLCELCNRGDWDTCKVVVGTAERIDICNKIGASSKNWSRLISDLKKSGAISGDKGTYYINPKYMWKGSAEKRKELIDAGYEFYAEFGFRKPEEQTT